jgi:glycosyltransferase involved in cell wall biosynthesis
VTGSSGAGMARYRFGFMLNISLGNQTRYLNLRKYAQSDDEIEFVWAPVDHYTPPDHPSRLRFLPNPLFMRARVMQQAWPVMRRLGELDAVMIHLFEADILCAVRSYWQPQPLRFSSTDEAPITDRASYPLYPNDLKKPVWRQKLRLALDMWRVRHTDYFIPFSQWVAGILTRDCGAPPERVFPLHVGLDLDIWQPIARPAASPDAKPKILFVGGDFERKGGKLLLEVFTQRLRDRAELHLVSRQAPTELPPGVYAHRDFRPNDKRLTELYAACDLLVVPTTADTGPLWVFMEAMAMGCPIIGTDTGSNKELVRHGETGFIVRIGDAQGLGDAIETMLRDPVARRAMGARGRRLIETEYSAAINVPRILKVMKDAVDQTRLAGAGRTRRAP